MCFYAYQNPKKSDRLLNISVLGPLFIEKSPDITYDSFWLPRVTFMTLDYFYRNGSTQRLTLMIIQKIMASLTPENLLYVMPSVTAFAVDPDVDCRTAMVDILMALYDRFRYFLISSLFYF